MAQVKVSGRETADVQMDIELSGVELMMHLAGVRAGEHVKIGKPVEGMISEQVDKGQEIRICPTSQYRIHLYAKATRDIDRMPDYHVAPQPSK